MSQYQKLLLSIMSGVKDSNIPFCDLQSVLDQLGFDCRIKGSHFIYTKEGVDEIINIQSMGRTAKAYQVKQVRNMIIKYRMGGEIDA
jgi:virulence-associated protein VapD